MFPIVLTVVIVFCLLLWWLAFPLDRSGPDALGLGALFNAAIVMARLGVALIVWLIGMLIWSLWFR